MTFRPRLKEALLALYLLTAAPAAAARAASLGLSPGLLLFLGLEALLVACLILGAYARGIGVRAAWALLLVPGSVFLQTFETVTGQFLTYDTFITMVYSTGDTGNAVSQFTRSASFAVVAGLLLLGGILLKPRRRPPFPSAAVAAAPLAGALLLAFVLYARGGEGGRGLPPSFTALAYAGLAGWEAAADRSGPREPVRLRPRGPPPQGDLVFIIDESVVATYLDIDNPAGVRSGLAEPRPGVAVHNFGYAASVTNCSWGSNLTLRYGGTRTGYRRINATMPSLFAYARRAGFHTVYIDAQRPDPAANPLVAGELDGVERTISLGRVPVVDRDLTAAALIARYAHDGRNDFILINKVGAHFPVHDKYPDAFLRYRPALPRGHFLDISDTGSRAGFASTREEWREYRNAYRNTLTWNVGAFFDRLLGGGIGKATIVYTSDHGQNLHERGGRGLNTHCNPEPVMEEGLVPLVILNATDAGPRDWTKAAALNRNRASHYAIFPTLLTLMGYDEREVAALYGTPLDRPVREDFAFNALFNARLGRAPVWKKIDLARIASPSAGDGPATALAGGGSP
ncbi:MAG TPA: sulfatase-like hydrolase/transferase [Allosphingosinicella sp.]|jgi:hypothetical protein